MKMTQKNIRILPLKKKDLIGSYKSIQNELGNFSYEMDQKNLVYYSIQGILLKFVGVKDKKDFTPYVFTKENVHKLYLRKKQIIVFTYPVTVVNTKYQVIIFCLN